MTDLKKTITKGALGTVAAGAMALATFGASATPAMAGDRNRDRGVDAGDIIAGAVIIGGIAALAGAFDNDRDDRRYRDSRYRDRDYRGDNRGYDNRYNRGGRDRAEQAVTRCIRAAEGQAYRAGYRYARVTEIRDVDRGRRGFEVQGRIEVGDRGNGYRGRGGFDRGRFTCDLSRGRVNYIDFDNIRGLR